MKNVTIGYLPIAAGLPLFVGVRQGYFADAGFAPELVRFTSSNELGSAGTAGRLDAMMPFALNAAFDLASASGKRARLFGLNLYSDKDPHVVDYLVVRSGVPITNLAGLRGKRIGGFPGSVTKIFVQGILKKHGLQPTDYTYVELAPPNWQPALKAGTIDAASVMEPQASQIIGDGTAKPIVKGFFAKLSPEVPLSGHWLTEDFVRNNDAATVQSFVNAYDRSVMYIREHPHEARTMYKDYVAVKPEYLEKVHLNHWTTASEMDIAHVQKFADLLFESKGIQQKVEVSQYTIAAKH